MKNQLETIDFVDKKAENKIVSMWQLSCALKAYLSPFWYYFYESIIKLTDKCSWFTFGEGVVGGSSRAGLGELEGIACKIHRYMRKVCEYLYVFEDSHFQTSMVQE